MTFCWSDDVQSGPSGDMISRVGAESGIGTLEVSGFIVKKFSMLFLDNSSAVMLHAPGIWLAVKAMSK